MKKNILLSSLLGSLILVASSMSAQDCCYEYSDCCSSSSCNGDFFVGGEWLYWKAIQDKLGPSFVLVDRSEDPFIDRKAIRPNFNYTSGFRVTAGYVAPCQEWDANISYLYLPSHATIGPVVAGTDEVITFDADQVLVSEVGTVSSIFSKWDLTLSQIDVEFGKNFNYCNCFNVRPFFGFRALWGDQKILAEETDLDGILDGALAVEGYKQKCNAYGIEGGVGAELKIAYGFSLVARGGGSLLYAKYSIHEDFALFSSSDAVIAEGVGTDSLWTGLPTLEYFLGLRYVNSFCGVGVSAHVGWEQHVFFNANRLKLSGGDGNLFLQGLTLGVGVEF